MYAVDIDYEEKKTTKTINGLRSTMITNFLLLSYMVYVFLILISKEITRYYQFIINVPLSILSRPLLIIIITN